MDDRDAFAMAAMAAMIGNPGKDTYGKAAVKAFPVFAYEWADAMLAVRGDCDEISRLRAEVETLKLQRTAADIVGRETANIVLLQVGEIGVLRADNKHLRGEFEKAWPDAERYRWLRNAAGRGAAGSIFDNFNGSAVDECIDAARAAQGERT